MHVELMVDEPIEKLLGDWDLLEERVAKKFSTFRSVGSNIYGIRRRAVSDAGITDLKKGDISVLLEIDPDGPVPHEFQLNNIHIVSSGTPHQVAHSFSHWHINDMEEIAVKFRGADGELGYSLLIMRKPTGKEGESVAWYCEDCFTLLYERRMRTGELGLGEFWRGERAAATEYNTDPKLRTCPECGHRNPVAFLWNPSKDTPAEAQARRDSFNSPYLNRLLPAH